MTDTGGRWLPYSDHIHILDDDQPGIHVWVHECQDCGALVRDRLIHDAWHDNR